jgi:methylenetetrahydrofolate reductase (NADPH)
MRRGDQTIDMASPAGQPSDRVHPEAARALSRLLERAKYELIPVRSVEDEIEHLPPGATVTVTASPTKPIEDTVKLAVRLHDLGHDTVPHLAARMIRDRSHLQALLDESAAGGLTRAFVIAGDAPDPGGYADAVSLLRDMAELGHGFTEVGIACYPEGHPLIPDDRLDEALHGKAPFAAYMTTQMCFDAAAVAGWISRRRHDGLDLPVHVGVPGVTDAGKLIRLATRIGVGASRRFLSKHTRLLGHLVKPGGFAPDALLDGLGPAAADERLGIDGLHIFTFNQVAATEEWRRDYLRSLSHFGTNADEPT